MQDRSTQTEIADQILVVDDVTDTLDLINTCLSTLGVKCLLAQNTREATEILQNNKVVMALVDWKLPDGSGGDVVRMCKEIDPLMPVIVMSGIPADICTDALLGRADGFLHKPFSFAVLNQHVLQWLERIRATRFLLPKREQDIVPLEDLKNIYIRYVVELLDGNVSRAAERLGIHRQTVAAAMKT